MQKAQKQTSKMILGTEEEIYSMVIPEDHAFRQLNSVLDFEELVEPMRKLYSDIGRSGFDIKKGFKALLIQFWEDYSDREMEKAVRENMAIRWFCEFSLKEETPDHTYFCKLRKRLGTQTIADIFNNINDILREKGLFGDVFRFIDASSIISKTALWEERDKAIKNGEEALNNINVDKYAADKDARWGAKGTNNFWYGYKRHYNVDMRFGLIDKISVTPANVLDFETLDNIIRANTVNFMDKIYDINDSYLILKANNCSSAIIRKNNRKKKDPKLDSWRSRTRMPFEGTFSKMRKRAKFRSLVKVTAQCFMEAICHNLKKAISVPIN